MNYIIGGVIEAINLLITFDLETFSIVGLSLFITFVSTLIASVLGVLLGIFIGIKKFPFKKLLLRIIYSMMALPPVVVGLITAIIISRRGPLGDMQLMYTSRAMIIAQVILITPIITGLIAGVTLEKGTLINEVAWSLGADKKERLMLIVSELKESIAVAVSTGFGRGISEVGAVMIVGGNIKGHTRVMTTFIAMNNSMGNYSKSLAMGIVLITIAIITNGLIHRKRAEAYENRI